MHRRLRGFTIVEIAVVVSAVGLLMSIVLVTFNISQVKARDDKRTADALVIKTALAQYYMDNGEYPTCTNGGFGCDISVIQPLLAKYAAEIPVKDPKGRIIYYMPGAVPNAYGLLVEYEESPGSCKTGINMTATWWWSAPNCSGKDLG